MRHVSALIAEVEPTQAEIGRKLKGDDLVANPAFTLNRGMTFPVAPGELTGWILQIGKCSKGRAGWYLPRSVEQWLPRKSRALRHIEPNLMVEKGQQIHDWLSFGRPHMITAQEVDTIGHIIVFTGERLGGWSWTLAWQQIAPGQTRLVMRMRIARFRHAWLKSGIDLLEKFLVCAPFHKGLTERLSR